MNLPRPASRFPGAFLVIVLINILLYVFQISEGVDWMAPEMGHLIAWGANLAPLTLTGDPWRLFTSMFLHIGIIHLMFNTYMLLMLGGLVEREFGALRFTLIYLVSGLFGSLASALWYANVAGKALTVSAGASGALMGIAGACLAHAMVAHARGEESEAVTLRGPLVQTIGLNLVLGFINPGVDNACHVGGLLAGALLGGAFALTNFGNNQPKRLIAALAISAASLSMLWLIVSRPPSAEMSVFREQVLAELAGVPDTQTAGQAALQQALQQALLDAAARGESVDQATPPAD